MFSPVFRSAGLVQRYTRSMIGRSGEALAVSLDHLARPSWLL
jgi:hypothetical protein